MVAAQVCADVGAPYVQGRSSAASPRVRSSLRRQPLKDPPVIFQGDLVALLQLLLLRLSVHLAHVGHQLLWPQALFHLRQLSLVLLQGVDKRDTHTHNHLLWEKAIQQLRGGNIWRECAASQVTGALPWVCRVSLPQRSNLQWTTEIFILNTLQYHIGNFYVEMEAMLKI